MDWKCPRCGYNNSELNKVCPKCGHNLNIDRQARFKDYRPPSHYIKNSDSDSYEIDGLAVASFVIAIVSFVIAIVPFVIGIFASLFYSLILGIIAILLGIKSSNKSGLATAGIVIGIIAILLGIIFQVWWC